MISPKSKTKETLIMIASNSGRILSKNKGKASMQMAFINNKVTRSQCLLAKMGKTFSAYSFSSSVPFLLLSSRTKSSIDKYPTVKPENNPEPHVSTIF